MALSKEEKKRRRAIAAGPFPKPRGRAPAGKTWDKGCGEWVALDGSSAPEAVATTAPVDDDTSCEVVVAWEVPIVIPVAMDHVYEHTTPADILLPVYGNTAIRLLHEHEQLSPRGSRAHTFEHVSPGGTTATCITTAEDRCTWRRQIESSRNGWRSCSVRGRLMQRMRECEMAWSLRE